MHQSIVGGIPDFTISEGFEIPERDLAICDMHEYIAGMLSDPNHEGIDTDPVLDMTNNAYRRIANGDHEPRVVEETTIKLGEYFLFEAIGGSFA